MVSEERKENYPAESNPLWYSQKISELRRHLGLSQAAFAQKLGVSGAAIGQLERGESKSPSADLLAGLTSILSVNLDWLLLGRGEMLKSEQPPQKISSYTPPPPSSPPPPIEIVLEPDTTGNIAAHLINFKAAANYLTGYQSQEYYEELDTLTLPPSIVNHRNLTAFYITGESMEPTFYANDIAICHRISKGDWRDIRPNTLAVVVSDSRGIQFKRVTLRSYGYLRCVSDNPHAPAFELSLIDDVLQICPFDLLLTARCEPINADLPERIRVVENEVGDLRFLVEQLMNGGKALQPAS